MKALILNSGLGSRMGEYTKEHPKCMTDISCTETILSRQLKILEAAGIKEVIITTGAFDKVLVDYCAYLSEKSEINDLNISFVHNPFYRDTNYIYSIYLARDLLCGEDVLLMHGDLVFEESVLREMIGCPVSCMKVSSTAPLPDKDFKAVVVHGRVMKVGVEFFDNAMEAQALYMMKSYDWNVWIKRIGEFCESGRTNCYAEVALNEITEEISVLAFDVWNRLCSEIDTPEDLRLVTERLREIESAD